MNVPTKPQFSFEKFVIDERKFVYKALSKVVNQVVGLWARVLLANTSLVWLHITRPKSSSIFSFLIIGISMQKLNHQTRALIIILNSEYFV